MQHPKRRLTVVGAVLGILAVASPAIAITAQPPFSNNVAEKVHTAGSDTTYFVMNDLGEAYNESEGCLQQILPLPPDCKPLAEQGTVVETENYDHDLLVNYFPQPSNLQWQDGEEVGKSEPGLRQLCRQDPQGPSIQVARVSSSLSPLNGGRICYYASGFQTGSVLRFIGFAKASFTWVRWPGNPVTNLTQAQLNDIFVECTITNWSQVGGANEPIRVWTAPYNALPDSDFKYTWDGFVGGNSENCIPVPLKDGNPANGERVIRGHRARPVEEAVGDPDAANEAWSILPFSVGIHNTSPEARQSSILGSVYGVFPNETTIRDGRFPFISLIYNVIRQSGPSPATTATRRFTNISNNPNDQTIGWLCKPEQLHSEPVGTPGAGIETPAASKDYGPEVPNTLRANGFFPLIPDTNTTDRRCTFTDVPVG